MCRKTLGTLNFSWINHIPQVRWSKMWFGIAAVQVLQCDYKAACWLTQAVTADARFGPSGLPPPSWKPSGNKKKMFGRTCLNIVFMHLSSTFSYKSFIRWSIRRNKSLILVFIQANVLTVSSYQHHEITLCQHMKQDISLVIAWVDALYLWLQKERQTRWITKHSAPAFTWTIILFW